MKRRELFLSLTLLALVVAGALAVFAVWRHRERTAILLSAVPPLPDLRRWPPGFGEDLTRVSAAARDGKSPLASLGELAGLYEVNGLAAEATPCLAALRRLDPKNPRWPYLEADLAWRAGDKAAAEAELRAALALDPTYLPGWLRLGEVQEQRHALAEARASLAHAIQLDPANPRGQYALLALEARQGGDLSSLESRLAELLHAHPDLRQLRELQADLLAARGDHAGAQRERARAEATEHYLDTSDPWLDELLAHCFDSTRLVVRAAEMGREGRYAEDEALLQRAVTLAPYAPANPFLWEFLSNLYLKTNRPADARATLEKAVAEFPDEPRMYELLAQLLRTEHASGDAIAVARRALVHWPTRGSLHALLGDALRDAGQNAEAVTALRAALRLDPTLTEAQYTLGCALLDLGRRADAHAALQKALAMRPDYPEALFAYGALVLEAGNVAEAEAAIKRLNTLRPDDANARFLLASLDRLKGRNAIQAGDLAAAAAHYEAGLAVVPDYRDLLQEAGALALRRQRPAEAAGLFRRYVQAAPDDPRGHLALGLALLQSDRAAEAHAVLTHGLDVARKAGDEATAKDISELLGP